MTDKNNILVTSAAKQKLRSAKAIKLGIYMLTTSLIVLAVLIVINLLASLLPYSISVYDTSTNQLYTVSKESEKFLDELKENITIKWICQGGQTVEQLASFLKSYSSCSPHIKYEIIDPLKTPDALAPYANDSLENYHVIVESEKRYTTISINSFVSFYNEFLDANMGMGEVTSDIYQQYAQYFYYAEQSGYITDNKLCADRILTQAIEYVTLEYIPHAYVLEGHGEAEFPDTLKDVMEYETITITDSIPADTGCIVINAPKQDISSSEARLLKEYLAQGGNMLLVTSPESLGHANLLGLMEDYGLSAIAGTVHETSSDFYSEEETALQPDISDSEIILSASSYGYPMLMPNSHGIAIDATAKAEVLMSTSDTAYIQDGEQKSETGKFTLAVAATKSTANGDSKLVWYASTDAFTEDVSAKVSYGNYYYLFCTFYWMNETYTSALPSIESVSMLQPTLDGLAPTSEGTPSAVYILSVMFILIIPAIALGTGLAVWIRRKRK